VRSFDHEVLGRLCQYLHVKPGVTDFAVKLRTSRAANQQNRRSASADYFFLDDLKGSLCEPLRF